MSFTKSRLTIKDDVDITSQMIDGVYVEIFTPSTGIKRRNRNKVLINVHGGGFTGGSRVTSQLESIPIAALGQIKVISIDYRMAPEYQFPAASEDIETVYRQLLKKYKPKNIGLYGCSAGGMLTAQSIAWFLDKKLPLPAAIGMFCLGAGSVNDSRADAAIVGGALFGFDWDEAHATNHYFQTMSPDDPLAYPGDSPTVLKEFPPSLLITGTRDFALSSVVKTHTELNRLDVEAELYVWEGQKHAFHFYPDIPESREAYDVIVKFFDKHLGK